MENNIDNKITISNTHILDEKYICHLYNSSNNNTLRQIAKMFNTSIKPIRRILCKNNITIRKTKYSVDSNFFENINTTEKAYLIGLIYADGSVFNRNFSISFQKQDCYMLDIINKMLNSNRPICKSNNYSTLNITNKKIVADLAKLGVVQNKTFLITGPDWLNKNLIFDFIRGVLDGDGYIYKKKDRNRGHFAITGNIKLLFWINDYLISNGIKSNLTHNKNKHSEHFELRVHSKESLKLLYNYLYYDNCICFIRKKEKFQLLCQ